MEASEFDIIEQYFTRRARARDDVILGIGDDAAVLQVPPGQHLVTAVDTLVAGRHFPIQTSAFDIGYKSLAVNLSDLAAMGATPAWATLALTLPRVDAAWLNFFADGFFTLADEHQVALVGGDTTRGPLSVSVQVHGLVPPGSALRRDAAEAGQAIFVTGIPGEAALALRETLADRPVDAALMKRLNRPQPRVDLGQALRGVATAAIDISDGLLADLGHILEASSCGATLWPQALPRSAALLALPEEQALACQFNGGDDYELCFTLPVERRADLEEIKRAQAVHVAEVGVITGASGIVCQYSDGRQFTPEVQGFDHFLGAGHD